MMKYSIRSHTILFVIAFLLLLTSGCAHRPYLIVDYKVPPASELLAGQKARIEIKDARADDQIFTPAAAQEFPGFENRYSLSWVTDKERIAAGEKSLSGLFEEAFKKRLEQMGATVLPMNSDNAPLFQVILQKMKIDLKDRKWMTAVVFEANLFMDNQLVARETVSGSAERVKIVGRKGADDTLSDIFTDIINRLDIVKLFQQAKLVKDER